jgi:hypothetical protein
MPIFLTIWLSNRLGGTSCSRVRLALRVFDGRLTHCIQIVALLPPPNNFLLDAMVLASNVRPPQATTCLLLAWFTIGTKAL